jgi:hypothetical protein
MTIAQRTLAAILLALTCAGAPLVAQSPPPRPEQQNEFIPLDQLPPQEQLPAPRLLVTAYVFVVGALFVYVLSISKRLGAVRREVERLEADLKRSGRA